MTVAVVMMVMVAMVFMLLSGRAGGRDVAEGCGGHALGEALGHAQGGTAPDGTSEDFLGALRSPIRDCCSALEAILDCHGASWASESHIGLYGGIWGYLGRLGTLPGRSWKSWVY